MRHIQQENEVDCGIATAAMLCGVSWSKALEADGKPESESGLTTKEFIMLCLRLGRPIAMVRASNRAYLKNSPPPPERCCAIMVRRNRADEGHYVAFDGKMVYDPGCKRPVPWSVYRKRRWKACRWFVDARHPAP